MNAIVNLAVVDFALPAPPKGSIDIYSGLNGLTTGLEMHKIVQQERLNKFSNYKAEVTISHQFFLKDVTVQVTGKMDGIYESQDKFTIEEIKSNFNIFELYRYLKKNIDHHPYILQLRTYGYFHWLKNNYLPDLTLCLVSTRNNKQINFNINLNIQQYEKWLDIRLKTLLDEFKFTKKTIKRRKKASTMLTFPFQNKRPGQKELISAIEEAEKNKNALLIHAPPGLGKTMGVLYPTLKEALGRGQQVIYLTPKNSQHGVAEDAIKRFQAIGVSIKSLTLTAKSKMCFKSEPICNSDYCEFAKNHYSKVEENKLAVVLAKKRKLTANTFKVMAKKYQVCPFELQFEVIKSIDCIICDYNYVFSPRASMSSIIKNSYNNSAGKPNLIIDELHNLPARSMSYYSPCLSSIVFEKMLLDIGTVPEIFREKAKLLLNKCLRIIKSCAPDHCKIPLVIVPPIISFTKQEAKLRDFLSLYLNSNAIIESQDLIMRFTYYWSEFTAALEFINNGKAAFFTTYYPNPAMIKITCCDASEMLRDKYNEYQQIVGFSATLKPFNFYTHLTGLNSPNLKTIEFISPFPKSKRKILIIPQVSSKYSDRERNYPKIAEVIQKVTSLKMGNYLAFFPSFEFLEKTLQLLPSTFPFKILQQKKSMNKEEINNVLGKLCNPGSAQILFAVQGGVFSEGIDYSGDMAIGVFIIGAPLPNYDLEREKMKEYYQKKQSFGYEYAYIYPAMAKAVQAAGRVIRSENDKGIIILMDNRYIQSNYAHCMPQDWFEKNQNELVSNKILSDLTQFWNEKD